MSRFTRNRKSEQDRDATWFAAWMITMVVLFMAVAMAGLKL